MVLQDLDFVFDSLDVDCHGYVEWIELKEFDECLFYHALDIEQLEAAIKTVCGPKSNGRCKREYFPYIVKELERRHFMEEKIKWDFRALDLDDVGRISVKSALFLFKAVHGDKFSQRLWHKFVDDRLEPDEDVNFDEIKIHLCNIPEFASSDADHEFLEQENNIREQSLKKLQGLHKNLLDMQEDESTIATAEQERKSNSSTLKNKADNLLNRMDEIGMEALLEDDLDSSGYGGRPKEKVTASEILEALKEKYAVLRERLLGDMLRRHVGDGNWQAMSEHEQQEKLMQLKLKEEKLRREGKIDTMAIHLPGARTAVEFNVFGLMGESIAELERRIFDEEEKVKESGLSSEEVSKEFSKKLDSKEKENSSTEQLLSDLNNRYSSELDLVSKRFQGLGNDKLLSPAERESCLFALVQARLRGVQESQFKSASVSVGLTERIQPVKQDRSSNDPGRHLVLGAARLQQHKSRRSHDGPVVPPKLFPLKSKLGRVDLALQLLQESERRYSLEREFLLSTMNTKEFLMHRTSAKKLNEDERQKQLSVLLAQWKAFRSKRREEKRGLLTQNRKCLEEACALKLESLKIELEAKDVHKTARDDLYAELLARLQKRQDSECRKIRDVGSRDKDELEVSWKEQVDAIVDEWFENVAVVLFGIVETSPEEEELLKALNEKYDSLRDKLLLDALMNQFGKSEWDKLSEQERQNQLARLRMLEKKLRREGKYDELSKLLGDSAANSDLLGKMLGENRQKYMDQLNERLRNRQRRIDNGEDPVDFDDTEQIDERPDSSTGNILMDLDKRFENEKDALLRRLREEQDREMRERERQAELARLRLEARKAARESNFDGAALVLGLAERNKTALEHRLKSDRERQEQLARERLAARRNRKKSKDDEDTVDPIEPAKDDITGWQDSVLKELERKHSKERDVLLDLLQENGTEDLKQEAREMSVDQRNERLVKLKTKRNELDISVKSDQEEHIPILEMALSIKYVNKHEQMTAQKSSDDATVSSDDIIVSLTADLQQLQDEETRVILEILPQKTQQELATLREKQIEDQKYERVENVANLAFTVDSETPDNEIVKALDKKYDTLMDKLLLEALKKQMGDADWAKMNEQERQRLILKKRLEQKKLLKEGKFDEAARLLGEGFKTDANLQNLMGENRKKYQELLEQRLKERQERLARGEPVDDLESEELPEENLSTDEIPIDAKSLLEDLQKRYDDEKDELLARLQGSTSKFMDERERQTELARLKREQRRAQQEEKFGAAALVFGLAERNQNAAQERLKNDRARQEQLAKERLARLRSNRTSKDESNESEVIAKDGDSLLEVLIKHVDERQTKEQMQLIEIYQNKKKELLEAFEVMAVDQRQHQLQMLLMQATQEDKYEEAVQEMVCLKHCNRFKALASYNKKDRCSDDNLLVTLLADLQQIQDKESEVILKTSLEADDEQILEMQAREMKLSESKQYPNVPATLTVAESIKSVDENVLVEALETKYDTLKDKLILDALEKQAGAANWAQMNERERQQQLLRIKLQEKKLKQEGKMDEASRLMNNLLQRDTNLKSLLGATKEEQEKRLKERLEKRKQRKSEGMGEEEIEELEVQEDKQFEEAIAKETTGNALEDLQKNFDAEKDALLGMLNNADAKLNNERKRQLELARLRREARKAQAEEKFDAAALVLGMAKSQQAAVNAKIKGARSRQEQLARERIQALKEKRQAAQQHHQSDENVSNEESLEALQDTDNVITLQENVLSITEKNHKSERDLLMKLIRDNHEESEQRIKAKDLSDDDKASKLYELKERRKQWRENEAGNPVEQQEMFKEAISVKLEQLHAELNTENEDESSVKLLADLQDHQDKEAEYLMKDLYEKDICTLKQLIQIQHHAFQQQIYDNVAATLLGVKLHRFQASDEKEIENELVEALKEKYDALKDKIYEEALKAKFGEEVWNAMSEKEQQQHLINMRVKDEFNKNNDEMSADLDSITLPGMEKLIGKTRAKQDKIMKERMERRKRAKAEGKTEEGIKREEEQEDLKMESDIQKGSDVIKDLQSQFEVEKDAILGMLMNADSKDLNERERQLALAKLRRDKLKIKREQKYDGAALVMNLGKTNEDKRNASLENERGRQEQLARERIAALKRKREEKQNEKSELEKLEEEKESDEKDDLSTVEQMQRGGTVALQDAVLDEMEKKHSSEQDALMDMVQVVETEKSALEQAAKLSDGERKEQLNLMSIQKTKLKQQSNQFLSSQPPENTMNEEEKETFNACVTTDRETQLELLKDALALKIVETRIQLKNGNVEESNINEEASVKLMADLQEKQTQEGNALLEAMQQSDNETVERLKGDQRKARRGGWMENVAIVVFGKTDKKKKTSDPKIEAEIENEMKEEEANFKKEADEEMAEFQKEIAQEREKKLASMSDDEINTFMKQLKEREDEKRKAVQEQIEKQRELAKQRMAEKRKKRDEKEYESDLASALIVNAQKRSEMMREKTMAAQGAQKGSLEERLRRRREERKKRQEEEAEKQRQEEAAEKQRQEEEAAEKQRQEEEKEKRGKEGKEKEADNATDESKPKNTDETPEHAEDVDVKPQVKKKKLPPLPGGGMKREKTVVEKAAEISDDKKKEMVTMMMREQTTMALKINKEQHRQEELVRELREKRRKKMEARNEEAAKLLGLGARQKTMVEDKKKVERERQIDQIRERVNRIRQGRTQGGPVEPEVGGETTTFADMAENSDHVKMEKLAEKMEKQLKDGAETEASKSEKTVEQNLTKSVPPTATLGLPGDAADDASKTARGKLDEKTRASIMKERQRQAKLRRGSQIPPGTEETAQNAERRGSQMPSGTDAAEDTV